MSSLKQDFTLHVGETVVLQITVTKESGGPEPLTGATIDWRMATSVDVAGSAVLEKTTASGITITDAVNGVFQVALAPADTAALAAVDHLHQAIVTFSNGDVAVVTQGKVTVLALLPAAA